MISLSPSATFDNVPAPREVPSPRPRVQQRVYGLTSILLHCVVFAIGILFSPTHVPFKRHGEVVTATDSALNTEFVDRPEESAPTPQEVLEKRDHVPADQIVVDSEGYQELLPRPIELDPRPPGSDDLSTVQAEQGWAFGLVEAGGGSSGGDWNALAGAEVGLGQAWTQRVGRGGGKGLGRGAGTGNGMGNGTGDGIGTTGNARGVSKGSPDGAGRKQPGVTRNPIPERLAGGPYPKSARLELREGVVLLRVRVLETGRVGEVQVVQTSGHGDLDAAAFKAAQQWRFKPALSDDGVVAAWVEVPVKYVLREGGR